MVTIRKTPQPESQPRPRLAWPWRHALGVMILAISSGCGATRPGLYPPKPGEPTRTVYVTANGWHSGIVLPAEDLPAPLAHAFGRAEGPGVIPPAARWIEFGWGDDAFYKAERETSGMTLAAMLWPTRSTTHLWFLDDEPPRFFRGYAANVYRLTLGEAGYAALGAELATYLALDDAGRAIHQREGLYGGGSAFFAGRRAYHVLHNCNQMSADVLRAAGLPLSPGLCLHAVHLERQLQRRVGGHEPTLRAWDWRRGVGMPVE